MAENFRRTSRTIRRPTAGYAGSCNKQENETETVDCVVPGAYVFTAGQRTGILSTQLFFVGCTCRSGFFEDATFGCDDGLAESKRAFDAASYVPPTPIGRVVSAADGHRFYAKNRWLNAVVMRIYGVPFRPEGFGKGKGSQNRIAGAE